MARRNRNFKNSSHPSNRSVLPQEQSCFEGDRLARLIKLIKREIDAVRLAEPALPEKFWFKQQFAVGVNDVTRVLERMAPVTDNSSQNPPVNDPERKASSIKLQAIILACDCSPRWLTKHLPSLASSRNVPLILTKDKKASSLRLGELAKLKTAIAIGVKVKGSSINQLVEEVLRGSILGPGTDSEV